MFQPDLLNGKRVLITGGGSGLGKAMGRRLMELGADLMICGRRKHVLEETANDFEALFSRKVRTHPIDIRSAEAVEELMDVAFAGGALDVLVNNAAGNFIARTETLSHRAVDAVLNIVLHGTAYCARRRQEMDRTGPRRGRSEHCRFLRLDRFPLRSAERNGQGRRTGDDPEPGR
jgi:NAD(P)-dependent dehydrogenase (short-subunit alcohol dehydrogenase family)